MSNQINKHQINKKGGRVIHRRLSNPEAFNGILEKLDQTAIIVDNEGEILYANHAFVKLLDLEEEQVLGVMIYDPLIGLTTRERFRHVMENVRLHGGKFKFQRHFLLAGRVHYEETTMILFDISGQEEVLMLSQDINSLKYSQMRAEELNHMLNKIIDNLPAYLFVKDVDDDLRYLIWNKAFAEYSKIPAEEVIGRTDFEVFPDYRDAKQFREDDLKVIETGEMTTKQETYMAADGKTRVVQTFKTLVHRQQSGPLLVGISLDVTDIQGIERELVKERLRAEESDRLKSRFLANMSHEIRTPLNAIVGFAGMLPDAENDAMRQRFLHIICENSELLLQLINDILDVSKIEAGTLDYTRMPMDLYETCHNLLFVYQNRLQEGVHLYFDNELMPERLIINEDRHRLMQVLDNLLNNAAKFTASGEIHYGFRVNGDNIEVYVTDTGKGIPADKHEDIFNRFVKLDNFTQGTGLGLAISKQIVETLGGKLSVMSTEGKGSTFMFTIPTNKKEENGTDNHKREDTDKDSNKVKDKLVLIAEDVNSNFLVVKTMLKGRYEILWAKQGEEAVEMAREHHPDLILMDIKMPVMNGLEASRAIREFDKDVPIVAMTANAYEEDRQIARDAGMNNFLPKPLNRDAFEAVLAAYL